MTFTQKLRFPKGLYGITPEWDDTPQLLKAIYEAVQGGMVALQWRRKTATKQQAQEQAQAVVEYCKELGIISIINDDWRLAQKLHADGVHLGRDDGSLEQARQALGAEKIIGSSCYNDLIRAQSALDKGVDYIAFGAVYPSSVKPDATRANLETLQAGLELTKYHAQDQPRAAVVAIGGITPNNLKPIIQAGADSAALISGLFSGASIRENALQCTRLFHF